MGVIRGNFTKEFTNREEGGDIKRRGGITGENMGEMKKYCYDRGSKINRRDAWMREGC